MINLNLDSALNSIIIDDKKGNNHVPDPLQFSYFIANKESIFKEIQTDINSGKYKVENLLLIDVPKPNFTIRPMARPQIRDWVTYQALIDMLIPQIVTKTSDRAYSSRRFSRRKGGIGPWKEFDQKSREYYNSGFKYVVVTDISGYFENINLDELRNKLINYIKDDDRNLIKVIDTLYNQFLVPWSSGRIKNFGLPQGPTASSFLGDVYLDNFDCELEEEPGYLRYVDDIRIFARSEVDAKIALMKIIRALRKYKLSINAKKTKILYDTEISSTIFDHKKPILDAISNAFETKHESKVLAITPILVDDIFSNSFSEDEFSKRHLEFSLFRLIILKSSGIPFDEEVVLGKIFDNFVKKPGQANYFCSFLSLYVEDRRVMEFLINFLISRDNIYEWQEMHVLKALLEMKIKLDRSTLKEFFSRIKDKNRHWLVRTLYALLVGVCGENTDRELLRDEFENIDENELKKGVVLSLQELKLASRNNFYNFIKNKVWPASFIGYLKTLKEPIYIKVYPRIKIELIKEFEPDIY